MFFITLREPNEDEDTKLTQTEIDAMQLQFHGSTGRADKVRFELCKEQDFLVFCAKQGHMNN